MLWTTWDTCWEYDVHSCGSFFLFYPVIYLELYLYVFSSHSASFSLLPCWSLIVSLPGLSWHQGLLLAQQCCPRSDTPLPYSWCSQILCPHKGEAKVTWTHLKQSETGPRQTHSCWHPALPTQSSTFSFFSVMGNSCFQSYSSKHSDLLAFLLLLLFKIQPPFIKCTCLSPYVHTSSGNKIHLCYAAPPHNFYITNLEKTARILSGKLYQCRGNKSDI